MTVTKLAVIDTYIGLAADTKPTTGVRAGSKFFERDTGLEYAYDGTTWGLSGATTLTVTIAINESLSAEVDLGSYRLAGIVMPAAWDAGNLTFQVASATGGTFQNLYDDGGSEVVVTAAVSTSIAVDLLATALAPWRFIKVRSGTAGAAVVQTAARTITLVLKQ